MAGFLENFRAAVLQPQQNPFEQAQPGYRPQNQPAQMPQQSANFSPESKLVRLINIYNNSSDWTSKERAVNAMMESFPNADRKLKNWIKLLDRRTQESKDQYDLLSWGVEKINQTNDLDERMRVVNYLMENVPEPSKWYRDRVTKLDQSVRNLTYYDGDLNKKITINDIGRYE